jgi:hypothetical protein
MSDDGTTTMPPFKPWSVQVPALVASSSMLTSSLAYPTTLPSSLEGLVSPGEWLATVQPINAAHAPPALAMRKTLGVFCAWFLAMVAAIATFGGSGAATVILFLLGFVVFGFFARSYGHAISEYARFCVEHLAAMNAGTYEAKGLIVGIHQATEQDQSMPTHIWIGRFR